MACPEGVAVTLAIPEAQSGEVNRLYPGTKQKPDEGAKALAKAAKSNPRLEVIGQEVIENVTFGDGTTAALLTTEFLKDGSRRSLQMKLLAVDADSNGRVVSGFLVGGKESKVPSKDSAAAQWLRACLTSFCFDRTKLDEAPLAEASQKLRANERTAQ